MKHSKSLTVILVFVLLVGVLLVAAITYYNPEKSQITEEWTTYVNQRYGFSFQYPTGWKISEDVDGTGVKVQSGDMLSIEFKAQENSAFSPIGTKMGDIRYDASLGALVDTLDTPARCLPSGSLMGINETLPAVVYGGSTMSDPAYVLSAILTDENYMILVNETNTYVSNRKDAARISAGKLKIYSTFALATTIKARAPKCTASIQKASDLIDAGTAVLTALKAGDYRKLETLTSQNGLSFNVYPNLDLTKTTIVKDAVSDIPIDSTQRMWGYTDGKGDEIVLTTREYMHKYMYTADYLHAEKVVVGKTIGSGNSRNTILEDAGDRAVIAYHFSGFDSRYAGMDWTTMYLIFENENGSYRLRGIAKDNWTI